MKKHERKFISRIKLRRRHNHYGFLLFVLINLIVCGSILAYAWHDHGKKNELIENKIQIQNELTLLDYYHEVTLMATNMAAATGDLKWQKEYEEYITKLHDEINELLYIFVGMPEFYENLAASKAAHNRLERKSSQVFKYLQSGKIVCARKIVEGNEFKRQSKIFLDEFGKFRKKYFRHTADFDRKLKIESASYKLIITFSLIILNVWIFFSSRKIIKASNERKKLNDNLIAANNRLFNEQKYFKGVVENVGIGISVLSPDLEIFSLNKKMREWFPELDISQKPNCYKCFNDPPRSEPCSYCPVVKTIKDGQVHEAVTKTPAAGQIRNYRILSTPIFDDEGKLISIIELTDDITEQKEKEAELKKARQKAETANKAKSEFLANMSHEIRTPMNSIIGFSDLMLEEKLSRTQSNYVNIIRNSSKTLLALINDILDFSKIEAGKLNVEIVESALGNILADVESVFRAKAAKKGIDFEVLQCDQLPAKIKTDPTRLNQCLINLINNAIKFTDEGHVYLNVGIEEIDRESFIRFDVEDTGIGIAKEKQKNIFEAFSQADSSTTRKYGGTGLGLTITKKLADLMGGKLSLHSKEGRGSVFTLIIPVGVDDIEKVEKFDKYQHAEEKPHVDTEDETGKLSGTVLVAEDSKPNQMLIRILLEKAGAEVDIVSEGQAAVDKICSRDYSLVLMDINMTGMGGFEAIKAIRNKGFDLPVFALTATADDSFKNKCINAGFDGHISKPIDKQQLMDILQAYLEGIKQDQ